MDGASITQLLRCERTRAVRGDMIEVGRLVELREDARTRDKVVMQGEERLT